MVVTCLTKAVCHNQLQSWTWVRWISSQMVWWCQIKWDSPISKCRLWIQTSSINICGRTTRHLSHKMVTNSSSRWCLEAINSCKWINQWTICKDTVTCRAWTPDNRIQFHLNLIKLINCPMGHNKLLKTRFK